LNRNWWLLVLGLLAGITGEGLATQGAAPAGRVIWRGVMTEMTSSPSCEEQVVQTFEFEGDERETGTTWRSRKVTWNQSLTCAEDVLMLVDEDGDATTPPRRMLRPWGGSCENQGQADLQATPDPSVRSRCQETPRLGYVNARTLPTLGWTGPRPDDQMRDGCAFNTRSRTLGSDGTVGFITVSITVSRGQPDAVVDVDRREYDAFVPGPGKTLTFTARSVRPARFRFELERDGTSRFPGYATNANVDEAFFLKHNLTHLRGTYANDGADMIFDPERFSAVGWSRRDRHFVETRSAEGAALAPVTAMDYGAVGRLRAYVESADCGGSWQPIAISIGGQRRDAIDIPLDADNNLIADALEQYRGLDSGADADAEPKGNGMAGDGLTAFEEYRGFLTRGPACATESGQSVEPGMPLPEPFPDEQVPSGIPGWDDEHIRSAPDRKDLFVHTPDPDLVVMLGGFAWASGLTVHAICEPHYVDNASRVVNFTLQQAGLRRWKGRTISQPQPQHGLAMLPVEETEYSSWGTAIPVAAGTSGPPKYTWYIEIRKPPRIPGHSARLNDAVERAVQERRGERSHPVEWVVVHELGHAVGLTHHADDVREWRDVHGRMNVTPEMSPFQRAGGSIGFSRSVADDEFPDLLLVDPGPECHQTNDTAAYSNGSFVGCLTGQIVRRGQQNSGEMDCPMRYPFGDWYEPPGITAVYLSTTYVSRAQSGDVAASSIKVDVWSGNLRRYRDELDHVPAGKMCISTRGTGINDAPGHLNHSGDAGRHRPCAEFIVINDTIAPDPPR
jgi:hypothetical protein